MSEDGINARGKAEDILNRIVIARNIHTPNQAQLKNEIIKDLESTLAKNRCKQIKKLSEYPFILLLGDDIKALLVACYVYCNKDINLGNKFDDTDGMSRAANFNYVNCWEGRFYGSRMEDISEIQREDTVMHWIDCFRTGGTMFLHRLEVTNNEECKDTFNYFTRMIMEVKARVSKGKVGLFIISADNENKLPEEIRKQFEIITLDSEATDTVENRHLNGKVIQSGMKIVRSEKNIYWEGNMLPNINEANFNILHELAKAPNRPVRNDKLSRFINSDSYPDKLLNQRISTIRKAFPFPYSDIKQSQCVIPDAKQNKGFRKLNLTKIQVEII